MSPPKYHAIVNIAMIVMTTIYNLVPWKFVVDPFYSLTTRILDEKVSDLLDRVLPA
jgi:hypothetical protein